MKYLEIIIFIFAICLPLYSQTIHKDDLPYFVGAYAIKYPGLHERIDTQNGDEIDCSKFIEWKIVGPDSQGYGHLWDVIPNSKERFWVFTYTETKAMGLEYNYYHPNLTKYQYFIMSDLFGWDLQINVLTVWEPVGKDSLRYYCGQYGPFNTSIGAAKVVALTLLPDTSILLAIKFGGEGYAGYNFARGVTQCHFEKYYEDSESNDGDDDDTLGNDVGISVNLNQLHLFSYKVAILREYSTYKKLNIHSCSYYQRNLDSTKTDIIDLWQKAKDYFNIDTTGVPEKYWR